MFKPSNLLLLALGLTLPSLALADMKIAVVNVQQAAFETIQGKELEKRRQAELKPEVERLKALESDIQKLQQKFNSDKDVLSDVEKAKMSAEGQVKSDEYTKQAQKAQAIAGKYEQELGKRFGEKMQSVLKQIGETEKYDLILRSEGAVYAAPARDLTKHVTELLDRAKP